MGRARQYRPSRLAKKLLRIRNELEGGLSQDDMVRRLDVSGELNRNYISCFERGTRIPPLNILLAYARIISSTGGGEYLEALIDDELDLPERLPADPLKERPNRKAGKRSAARLRRDA